MDARYPESLCQPHTRLAPCHLIVGPQLGLAWLPADSNLGWLLFSPGYDRGACGQVNRAELCLAGATVTPFLGYNLLHSGRFLTLAPHLGKGGSGVREGGEKGKEEAPS